MNMRQFVKILDRAQRVASERLSVIQHGGDKYARGLAPEGYDGGYRDALSDVAAMIAHGYPSDLRGIWREAREQTTRTDSDTAAAVR